jgi:hypothetical protein
VSNTTDDDIVYLSPSRLATYADCQRKFDHDYVKDVSTPDQNRLYLNQGLAYHETIEAVCEATDHNDDADVIYRRAMDAFDEKWNDHLEPDEYESRAHQDYQRAENRAAIEAFFDPNGGDGIQHARQSVATEIWLEAVHDGLGLHGYADNVLRTEDGLHIIDYKRGLSGIITSYTAKYLEEYDDPVTQAGYAYVGDIGPTVESRTFSETELQTVKDDVTTAMNRIVEFSFSEYSAGDHCRWCQHNQLPCAPDSLPSE